VTDARDARFVAGSSGSRAAGLVLKAKGLETFVTADVRRVRARDRDSLKNGTLIGLGVGPSRARGLAVSFAF